MAEDVRQWLKQLGCEHYHPIFVQNGFTSVASLNGLSENALTKMAVINHSHRQAILDKARTSGTASTSAPVDFDDFDNLLGDLTSAIADLESITAPGKTSSFSSNSMTRKNPPNVFSSGGSGSSSTNSTPVGTPYNSLQREERKPIQGHNLEASLKDADLDALLTDLCDFDPMKEMSSSKPLPTNPIQFSSPSHTVVAQTPPIPHARPTPPPPATQPVEPPIIQVESNPPSNKDNTDDDDGFNDLPVPANQNSPHVTSVHEPRLQGASEEITKVEVEKRLASKEEELRSNPNISESEVEDKMKDEKMMIALEKMKLASKRKVAIKVFNNDGSNKTVVVEEGMSAAVVCYLLVTKNHFEESPNWTIIERLGDVNLERELEDHESVESIYTHWARDSNNQFLFRRNNLKYEIFTDPIKYFPALLTSALIGKEGKNQTDKARKILVQEYFTSALRVPEIEGHLHLKDGYKNKSWKKIYVILRASGLYQTLKGKAKTAQNLKLLVQFEDFDMYRGMNFKKMLKAPTDFCFAFRPKPDQVVPGAKDIKVLCAESEEDFLSWFGGCRLAKYGHTLYDNYYKAHIKQFKLEDAGQQSDISAEQRAYSLSGMRLEKHLDKRREEYQREKEATKAQEMMFKKVADQQDSDDGSPSVPPKVAPKPKPKPTRQEHQPSPPLNGGGRVQDDPVSIDDLSQYPWYHGSIPRDEAIRRLEQAGVKDGLYLVRDSSSVANSFVLTMFAKSVPKNFQIMPYEGPNKEIVYRIDDGPPFRSIPEVLQHYSHTADRLPCQLTDFCPRPPTRMTEC